MDTHALVAALGPDASAAVHGYRLDVMLEAGRRGLRLVDELVADLGRLLAERGRPDPLEIRLTFLHCPGRPELAGRTLRWCPSHGWSSSHRSASADLSYFADSRASALDLVPTTAEVLDWATSGCAGSSVPPTDVDLDDDPRAIRRLLTHAHPLGSRPDGPGDERTAVSRPRRTDGWIRGSSG
ncbi:hypothetical protein GCM10010464_37550 [Pseudonocardia yunnanensis]|uniref:Uncharacterized protein n=1 Tax=Pseudonocardia yunnanensis TaxID=58107 RepID=A0ABW4FAZ3_9PSEU